MRINAELYIQVDNNEDISKKVKSKLMNDSRNVFENDTRKRYYVNKSISWIVFVHL